jgi:hypothetical protein
MELNKVILLSIYIEVLLLIESLILCRYQLREK